MSYSNYWKIKEFLIHRRRKYSALSNHTQTVGLLGGSFNPPHQGHLHISREALKRLPIDQLWWLVTPGNPMKDHSELKPIEERMDLCNDMVRSDPKILVSDIELHLGSSYTYDTIISLKKLYPRINFMWLMGGDNLLHFHKWEHWRKIMHEVPIAILDREGTIEHLGSSPISLQYHQYRMKRRNLQLTPPSWHFMRIKRNSASSTALRAEIRSQKSEVRNI